MDVSAVRESPLTLSLTKTNALCTTLKNSTTQESMRCPWTWRIWFKFSRHLLQKPTSHIQKRSWPFNDLSIPRKVTTTKKRMLKITCWFSPMLKKIWNLLWHRGAFGVPLWRKLLLQTFIQKKSVYSEIHKDHLKIMLFPADENSLQFTFNSYMFFPECILVWTLKKWRINNQRKKRHFWWRKSELLQMKLRKTDSSPHLHISASSVYYFTH